jgi:hypothetical protein
VALRAGHLARLGVSAQPHGISKVLGASSPADILDSIIARVTVIMPRLVSRLRLAVECSRNEAVNERQIDVL